MSESTKKITIIGIGTVIVTAIVSMAYTVSKIVPAIVTKED